MNFFIYSAVPHSHQPKKTGHPMPSYRKNYNVFFIHSITEVSNILNSFLSPNHRVRLFLQITVHNNKQRQTLYP